MIVQSIQSWFSGITINFITWLITWLSSLSFWITCIGSVVALNLYIVSWNKKYIQWVWVAIVIYIFLKGAEMSL